MCFFKLIRFRHYVFNYRIQTLVGSKLFDRKLKISQLSPFFFCKSELLLFVVRQVIGGNFLISPRFLLIFSRSFATIVSSTVVSLETCSVNTQSCIPYLTRVRNLHQNPVAHGRLSGMFSALRLSGTTDFNNVCNVFEVWSLTRASLTDGAFVFLYCSFSQTSYHIYCIDSRSRPTTSELHARKAFFIFCDSN